MSSDGTLIPVIRTTSHQRSTTTSLEEGHSRILFEGPPERRSSLASPPPKQEKLRKELSATETTLLEAMPRLTFPCPPFHLADLLSTVSHILPPMSTQRDQPIFFFCFFATFCLLGLSRRHLTVQVSIKTSQSNSDKSLHFCGPAVVQTFIQVASPVSSLSTMTSSILARSMSTLRRHSSPDLTLRGLNLYQLDAGLLDSQQSPTHRMKGQPFY